MIKCSKYLDFFSSHLKLSNLFQFTFIKIIFYIQKALIFISRFLISHKFILFIMLKIFQLIIMTCSFKLYKCLYTYFILLTIRYMM